MGSCIWDWSMVAAANGSADASIVASEGCAPGVLNDNDRAIIAAIARMREDTSGRITTGGSANAQTFSASTAYSSQANGLRIGFRAGFTNTGSMTFQVTPNGGAAFNSATVVIAHNGTTATLAAGMVQAGGRYDVEFNRIWLFNASRLSSRPSAFRRESRDPSTPAMPIL
jgi:hypothetical protein